MDGWNAIVFCGMAHLLNPLCLKWAVGCDCSKKIKKHSHMVLYMFLLTHKFWWELQHIWHIFLKMGQLLVAGSAMVGGARPGKFYMESKILLLKRKTIFQTSSFWDLGGGFYINMFQSYLVEWSNLTCAYLFKWVGWNHQLEWESKGPNPPKKWWPAFSRDYSSALSLWTFNFCFHISWGSMLIFQSVVLFSSTSRGLVTTALTRGLRQSRWHQWTWYEVAWAIQWLGYVYIYVRYVNICQVCRICQVFLYHMHISFVHICIFNTILYIYFWHMCYVCTSLFTFVSPYWHAYISQYLFIYIYIYIHCSSCSSFWSVRCHWRFLSQKIGKKRHVPCRQSN